MASSNITASGPEGNNAGPWAPPEAMFALKQISSCLNDEPDFTLESQGPPFCCRATEWRRQDGENKDKHSVCSSVEQWQPRPWTRAGLVGNHKFPLLPPERAYLGEAVKGSNTDTGAHALESECLDSNPQPSFKS